MSAAEFGLWLQAYQDEPWGDARADLRAGIVASSVANMAGKMLRKGKTLLPKDFMPRFHEPPEHEASPDEFFG